MSSKERLLSPVKSASLRDAVVNSLRQAILSGKLPPGTPLRGFVLAHDLGVSQGTVREALQFLQHEGLVTNVAGVGTAVTRLSGKELRERVSLRALLEGEAAVQAAPRMADPEFAELDRKLEEICRAAERNLCLEWAEADLEFHRYLWRCSGNETLFNLLDQLVAPVFAFIAILRKHGLSPDQSSTDASRVAGQKASHQPMIDALKEGNSESIRKVFASATQSAYERYYGLAMKIQPGLPFDVLDETAARSLEPAAQVAMSGGEQ